MINYLLILIPTLALGTLPPIPSLTVSNLAVKGFLTLNGTNVVGGGGSLTFEEVTGSGTNATYSGIETVQFDNDTGFNLTANGTVLRVALGSAWTTLHVAGGLTNISPSGEMPLALEMSTNVSVITAITNPGIGSYTLQFPYIPGPAGTQGIQGPPGFSFGVYITTGWSTNLTYTTNQWFNYGGDLYGVVATNFQPTAASPTNYLLSGEVIVLAQSGADGIDGVDGSGLIPYGTWSATVAYPELALVRHENAQYYTLVASSNQNPLTTNWIVFIEDGAPGAMAMITSNTAWGGLFDYTQSYASNTIVYYNQYPYGGYFVRSNYTESVGGLPGPSRLTTLTGYFQKIWHYAQDGAPGIPGYTPADGVGNMWFRTNGWEMSFPFTNAGIVVVHNDETFISITNSTGVEPGETTGWQSYWVKGAGKGVNGGLYKWTIGYSPSVTYTNYDVVIESNTAWLCTAGPSQDESPWTTPAKWQQFFTPNYQYLAQISTRDYVRFGTYTNSEIVDYDGGAYICTQSVTNAVSVSPATAYFKYWIHRGSNGVAGANGVTTFIYVYTNGESNVWTTIYQPTNYVTTNITTNITSGIVNEGTSNAISIDAGVLTWYTRTDFLSTTTVLGATNAVGGTNFSYNPTTRTLTVVTDASGASGTTITNIGTTLQGDGSTNALNVSATIATQAWQGAAAYAWGNHSVAGYATGTPLYVYTETDPAWTSGTNALWQAIGALEASTSGVTAAGATGIAQAVLSASLASVDTNSAASKQYVLNNVGTGGGTSTKSIGGRATDWAWNGSSYAAPRTTNGTTFLEFPLDTTNVVNGVQLVGVDGIAVTQLIIRATASAGGGTIGLLSGFGTALTTNVITIPRYTTNSIQVVDVSHVLTGMTNGLFRWGVLPTNIVGNAAGVAWVEILQARGAW